MRRILALARAEVLHVVRDRTTLAQMIIMPMVQLLILSNAATFHIANTPVSVVDLDRTPISQGLTTRLLASGDFSIVSRPASVEQANDELLRGTVTMVIVIPREFETSIVRTGRAPVEIQVNAEKGSAAGIVQSYAARIFADYAGELSAELHPRLVTMQGSGSSPAPMRNAPPRIEVRARSWYNATLNYKHYMVPGILVTLITMIGTLMTAQNIVREKELGTLEQLNVTPITRGQFIAAKLLPFWVIALLELGLGLALGHFVFGVPIVGSIGLLYAAAAVYLVVALGIGLFISTVVDTQQQAMFVTFFVMMIYLLMSGLFTPVDSMPTWVQWATELNPVRHFIAISRAILVKGAGLAEIAHRMEILLVYGAVVFGLAVHQHAKRAG